MGRPPSRKQRRKLNRERERLARLQQEQSQHAEKDLSGVVAPTATGEPSAEAWQKGVAVGTGAWRSAQPLGSGGTSDGAQ